MAKIEINCSPQKLARIACFLKNNNIKFKVVKSYANHSAHEAREYEVLLEQYRNRDLKERKIASSPLNLSKHQI